MAARVGSGPLGPAHVLERLGTMFLGPEARKQLAATGRVATIGIEMAISVAVGWLGGRWLDAKLHTGPWLEGIGFVLGLVAGFRSLYTLARRIRKQLSDDQKTPE